MEGASVSIHVCTYVIRFSRQASVRSIVTLDESVESESCLDEPVAHESWNWPDPGSPDHQGKNGANVEVHGTCPKRCHGVLPHYRMQTESAA